MVKEANKHARLRLPSVDGAEGNCPAPIPHVGQQLPLNRQQAVHFGQQSTQSRQQPPHIGQQLPQTRQQPQQNRQQPRQKVHEQAIFVYNFCFVFFFIANLADAVFLFPFIFITRVQLGTPETLFLYLILLMLHLELYNLIRRLRLLHQLPKSLFENEGRRCVSTIFFLT
jgi:hypothetical protein